MGVIRGASFVEPGVRLAVVGVILPLGAVVGGRANQANLVTVVDRWRAGKGHLEDGDAFEASDGVTPIVIGILVKRGVVGRGVTIQHEQWAVGIVAAQQVHHGVEGFGRIALNEVVETFVQLLGCEGREFTGGAAAVVVVVHKGGVTPEAEHSGAILVIHGSVPLLAEQPGAGIAPFFAHNVRFGVNCMERVAEAFPIIVGGGIGDAGVHVAADIQSPSIGALIQPVAGHAAGLRPDQIAGLGGVGLQLGQRGVTVPGFVGLGFVSRTVETGGGNAIIGTGVGEGGEVEPVVVVGCVAFAGAAIIVHAGCSIAVVSVKVEAVGGGVVEDAVQDDVHISTLSLGSQSLEVR